MTNERAIPTGSQTVGPYFKIGLDYLAERSAAMDAEAGAIAVRGTVLDRDGMPVPDAMLEFWSAPNLETSLVPRPNDEGYPSGFVRAATGADGTFSIVAARPAPTTLGDGTMQAPHMLVLVFARGLLRHLITRVYFEGEPANAADPVLQQLPAERRGTLIAQLEKHPVSSYRWNVVLQGREETVFFAW